MDNEQMRLEVLKGKRVVIVEDDAELATRLKAELEQYGMIVEGHIAWIRGEGGAIECLRVKGPKVDLLILDVMLPATEENYKQLIAIEKELKDLRGTFVRASSSQPQTEDFNQKLQEARNRRKDLLAKSRELIEKEGGVDLVEEVLRVDPPLPLPPVVFLTAVGHEQIIVRAQTVIQEQSKVRKETIRSLWLVKPQTIGAILDAAVDLIGKPKSGGK